MAASWGRRLPPSAHRFPNRVTGGRSHFWSVCWAQNVLDAVSKSGTVRRLVYTSSTSAVSSSDPSKSEGNNGLEHHTLTYVQLQASGAGLWFAMQCRSRMHIRPRVERAGLGVGRR